MSVLTRTVVVLSLVSLLTDISSEMLYPIMPLYLSQIGFSVLWIGILEGLAQFLIGLSNGYFAEWSDIKGKRMPFVKSGYLLSTISKPLMVVSTFLPWVFFMRLSERLGKGVRTGARDALLSDESEKGNEGRVFGFHRAMDTLGAAIGPIIALVYLNAHPGNYKPLFLYSFIPGIIAVSFLFLIREKKKEIKNSPREFHFFSFLRYWKKSSRDYKKIVTGLLIFSIFNSADIFLFLKAKGAGISEVKIISAYILYNLTFAAIAFPAGKMADKIGMKITMIAGLLIYTCTYAGFAIVESAGLLFILFAGYGIYAALTEGISKAWICQHCLAEDRGVAQGFLKSTTSIASLISGLLAGLIWTYISPAAALLTAAIGALSAIVFWMVFYKHSTE